MKLKTSTPKELSDRQKEALKTLESIPPSQPKKTKRQLFEEKHRVISIADVKETEVTWLIEKWIPEKSVTLFASDGGLGKTTTACDIASAISSGKKCILESADHTRPPREVLFFSGEDTADKTLKRKFRLFGANMENIHTISMTDEDFSKLEFSEGGLLEEMIDAYRPALVVFDPLQQFLPEDVDMAKRNHIRRCMSVLSNLAEKYSTTFLIIMHTNKSSTVEARTKLADSADLWDISRSVIFMGRTEQPNIRYISHEKSNYGRLESTVLFTIDNQGITNRGTTEKRFYDFQTARGRHRAPSQQNTDARRFILEALEDHEEGIEIGHLKEAAIENGISGHAYENAKAQLIDENLIRRGSENPPGGAGRGKGRINKLYPLKY